VLNLPGAARDRFLHLPLIRDNDHLPCTSVPEIRKDDPLEEERIKRVGERDRTGVSSFSAKRAGIHAVFSC
jgi:hypothetical protein